MDHLPTQLCLVLYSFCACLLHLLVMWLIISFILHITNTCYSVTYYWFWLKHNWPLWDCFVVLFVAIQFFLKRFSFLSHIYVFSYAVSLVCHLKYPYSCSSSHFCFLGFVVFLSIFMLMMLLFANKINLSLLFLI